MNWTRKMIYRYQMRSVVVSREDSEAKAADSESDVGPEDSASTPSAADRRRRKKKQRRDEPILKRWEADYQLQAIDRLHLFDEYIEMGESRTHDRDSQEGK